MKKWILLMGMVLSPGLMAFEPLATPDLEDAIFYDDEENSAAEVALGKQLFFDPRLSVNDKQSCATCHNPKHGFSDNLALGEGTRGNKLGRNTPQIYNMAWNPIFMWDGRAATLEEQALGPIEAEAEMAMPLAKLLPKLNAVKGYREAFSRVYGVKTIGKLELARALAAYERSIIVDNTPFDRFIAGDTKALSASERRGLEIYKGKGQCVLCHDGANFTDYSFHNLGIDDGDPGRAKIIADTSQFGAFKTPGLRNIAFSQPYMHDGSLADLAEVVQFYNVGGGKAKNKSDLVKPLNLSEQEQADLVAFLENGLTQKLDFVAPKIPTH